MSYEIIHEIHKIDTRKGEIEVSMSSNNDTDKGHNVKVEISRLPKEIQKDFDTADLTKLLLADICTGCSLASTVPEKYHTLRKQLIVFTDDPNTSYKVHKLTLTKNKAESILNTSQMKLLF